jgi:hypothetical protein
MQDEAYDIRPPVALSRVVVFARIAAEPWDGHLIADLAAP